MKAKKLRKIIRDAYAKGARDMYSEFRPKVLGVSTQAEMSYSQLNLTDGIGFKMNEEK